MSHEVVAALILRSGLILLGKRSETRAFYPGVWDMFGGHVEPGEGHAQTLVRELLEELGITPAQWEYLEMFTIPLAEHSSESTDQMVVHLYRVTEWDGIPANRQPEEHSEIRWFSLAEACRLDLADGSYPMLFERYGPTVTE